MGLLLLIPGLILQLNQTTWFSGEDAVGRILIIIGALLILVQTIFFLIGVVAVSKVGKSSRW